MSDEREMLATFNRPAVQFARSARKNRAAADTRILGFVRPVSTMRVVQCGNAVALNRTASPPDKSTLVRKPFSLMQN
jgi:hypothetical protein